ncbi:MAG: T9SS type A sorting domain-containing protein, partial [Bacteroidetes bacterium]|nr:T9SS type A sorting domain-containing protein [Bacteroidota bacterium]
LVSYTATDGSGNVSATVERWVQVIENLDGLGLGEGTANGLSVYPNPNNGKFVLVLGQEFAPSAQVWVYGTNGQLVFQSERGNGQGMAQSLDLSHLSAGVYRLMVRSGEQLATMNIAIE